MAYTFDEWRNMQVTAIDPYMWAESNEAKKITRAITLEKDIVFGEDSFLLYKEDKMVLKVNTGFAIKQDIYIHFHKEIILDLTDSRNYCVEDQAPIDEPGLYFVVLDYQYSKSYPGPFATIKIAKTFDIAYMKQMLDEYEDNRQREVFRYLVLGYFTVIDNNGLEINEFFRYYPENPNYRVPLVDLERITEVCNGVYLNDIRDFLVVENPFLDKQKVLVKPGFLLINNGIIEVKQTYLGPIPPISEDGKVRYDIVTIDLDGNLRIVRGNEVNEHEFETYAEYLPYIPVNQVLLATIRINETIKAEILDDDNDIINLRDFVHLHNLVTYWDQSNYKNSGDNAFLVYEDDPIGNSVQINPGIYISTDNKKILKYPGGKFENFEPTQDDNHYRYDLLTINDDREIECVKGLEIYNTRKDPYVVAPEIPRHVYPLAVIEVHGQNPMITRVNIFDARPFINMGGGGGQSVKIYPHRPADNSVYVEEFVYIRLDGHRSIHFLGGDSPTFDPLSYPNRVRYDYLMIDDNKNLKIIKGNEYTQLNIDPFEAAPDIPDSLHALGIIKITEYDEVKIEDKDIFIATETLNKTVDNFIELRKTDWNGSDTVWELPFNPDWGKPYIIIQDGIHLDEGYKCTINGNKIEFMYPPQYYTLFYGIKLHSTVSSYSISPKSAVESDWNGIDTEWELPFLIDLNLPVLVVRDGIVLEETVGYDIGGEGRKIIFKQAPVNFTLIIAYPSVNLDLTMNLSFGIREFTKTDWENNNSDEWDLGKKINTERPLILVSDGFILEKDKDFYILNKQIIKFITTPTRYTQLIAFISDNIETNNIAYEQCIKRGSDVGNSGLLGIDFVYTVGLKQLEVYIDRQRMFVDLDYNESSEQTIQFNSNVINNIINSNSIIVVRKPKFL